MDACKAGTGMLTYDWLTWIDGVGNTVPDET